MYLLTRAKFSTALRWSLPKANCELAHYFIDRVRCLRAGSRYRSKI